MVTRDFSGDDVIRVLTNVGGFTIERQRGSHVILRWEAPAHHDTENRVVTVPRHRRLNLDTLKSIADQAGARKFDEFCRWIDRNR